MKGFCLVGVGIVGLFLATAVSGQSVITYQGRLMSGNAPATGAHDVQFTLYTAEANGTQVGNVLTLDDLAVREGLFLAELNFEAEVFTGETRWLEIAVRPGESSGPYTILNPRQPIHPAPMAHYAAVAGGMAANTVNSTHLQEQSVTAEKIAAAQVVKSLNGLTDQVNLLPGDNITLSSYGNEVRISAGIAAAVTNYDNLTLNDTLTVSNINVTGRIFGTALTLGHDYSSYSGTVFNFVRPNASTMQDLRWYRADDNGSGPDYFAMGPDYAIGGNFFALAFVNSLGLDLLTVGTEGDIKGRFGMGLQPPKPDNQFTIMDLDDNIKLSMDIYSFNDGIRIESRANFSDGLNLHRNHTDKANYIRWSQGSGASDWRFGMAPGAYDLTLFNMRGATPSSPENPGTEYLRIERNSMQAVFGGGARFADNVGIGIGTNAPEATLHVAGNIKANGTNDAAAFSISGISGKSVTNTWYSISPVNGSLVTNVQVFQSGLLTSWKVNGRELE